jgi:hypothetical protein
MSQHDHTSNANPSMDLRMDRGVDHVRNDEPLDDAGADAGDGSRSVTHDRVSVMLHALLAVPVPDGYTNQYRERHDTVIDHIFRDVTIAPAGVEVSTFGFGTPGAYAHISVAERSDAYIVGVFATDVAYNVQSAGHVVAFTTAVDAVRCAIREIHDHLVQQERRR